MINLLDEAFRLFFIRELPIRNKEIDIAFDQPKREWSARLNRPTLNIFLHDLRENAKLRSMQWERQADHHNQAVLQRPPVRVDLHYLITAWANEPDDEHRLLTAALMALFRQTNLPQDILPENLQDQPWPIPLKVAQYDEVRSPADLWGALDNEMRPGILCMATLALNPFLPIEAPLVRVRELRMGRFNEYKVNQGPLEQVWTIGGTVHHKGPLKDVRLTLVERGLDVPLQKGGRFAIGNLEANDYTLEVAVAGQSPKRYPITVPAPDYEIET